MKQAVLLQELFFLVCVQCFGQKPLIFKTSQCDGVAWKVSLCFVNKRIILSGHDLNYQIKILRSVFKPSYPYTQIPCLYIFTVLKVGSVSMGSLLSKTILASAYMTSYVFADIRGLMEYVTNPSPSVPFSGFGGRNPMPGSAGGRPVKCNIAYTTCSFSRKMDC